MAELYFNVGEEGKLPNMDQKARDDLGFEIMKRQDEVANLARVSYPEYIVKKKEALEEIQKDVVGIYGTIAGQWRKLGVSPDDALKKARTFAEQYRDMRMKQFRLIYSHDKHEVKQTF